jgi:hypothetical protein
VVTFGSIRGVSFGGFAGQTDSRAGQVTRGRSCFSTRFADPLGLRALGPRYGNPASIFAVNKQTGALVWKTQADKHLASIITAGAVVDPATGIV